MAKVNSTVLKLKETCQMTSAEWAVFLLRSGDCWEVNAAYGLKQAQLSGLKIYIQQAEVIAWLAGAMLVGRSRWRKLDAEARLLAGQQIFVFPVAGAPQLFLVGADELSRESSAVWRMLMRSWKEPNTQPVLPAAVPATHTLPPAQVGHLERLQLLTDAAQATSSGLGLEEVARQIVHLLEKSFKTPLVGILLPSSDQARLREYGSKQGEAGLVIPMDATSVVVDVFRSGQPKRLTDVRTEPHYLAANPGVLSEIALPLLARGRTIGVLDLESLHLDAFSAQDEQSLMVISGHLGGLIENVRLQEYANRRAHNLSLIHRLTQLIVGELNPQRVLSLTVQEISLHFGGARVEAHLNDGKTFADCGVPPAQPGGYWVGQLYEDENPLGALRIWQQDGHGLDDQDGELLEAVVGLLSSIVSNALRFDALQRAKEQLQVVHETALDITGNLQIQELMQRIVRRAREMLHAQGADLALVNPEKQLITTLVSDNPWKEIAGLSQPMMSGLAGQVLRLKKPVAIEDYHTWEGRIDLSAEMPVRAIVAIPLISANEVLGVLSVFDAEAGRIFSSDEVALLEQLAPSLAISLRNARLYEELENKVQALRTVEVRLMQAARLAAIGEISSGVAHELNNPLTTVLGFIELAMEGLPVDGTQRADLELAMQEAHRARAVVRRMLEFESPSGYLRVKSDLRQLLREVLALVNHLVQLNNVLIETRFPDNLPWVSVDPYQVKQAFLNLVQNSLQAMPEGGVLSIHADPQMRDTHLGVRVEIRDSGIGMPPEVQVRLFEPFFTTKPQGVGTGLGLSVTNGIISEHHGSIEFMSALNQGSTFWVWLPEGGDLWDE